MQLLNFPTQITIHQNYLRKVFPINLQKSISQIVSTYIKMQINCNHLEMLFLQFIKI